jgi:hypothetical protein
MSKDSKLIYNYRFRVGQLVNFSIGAGFLGIVIYLLQLPYEFDTFMWILIAVLTLLGLISLGLTIHYWFRSFGLRITIDTENEHIEVMNKGRFNSYKFSDLTSIEICEHKSMGQYGFDFSFAKYTFENGKYCIATAFMTNQYFVPTRIKPRIYKEIVPLIKKRTNA